MLEDGLKSFVLDVIIGQRKNTPWSVVEASTQLGPSTKVLHGLYNKVSQFPELTSHTMRFNAFILGLLNIRSLEFWFNHLYNHEGNTQNPALSCQLNTGQSWEDQEGAAALLSLQSLEVGRRTTQAFISRLGLLPKSFPSLCYVRAWEPGGYSGNLEVRVARSLSSELKVAA